MFAYPWGGLYPAPAFGPTVVHHPFATTIVHKSRKPRSKSNPGTDTEDAAPKEATKKRRSQGKLVWGPFGPTVIPNHSRLVVTPFGVTVQRRKRSSKSKSRQATEPAQEEVAAEGTAV
mmetsp:Transcript_24455/g.57784  ORF Transcript_24455/g.57784 Transcript_24455/m.57784 type:complete len:118 (-) Transcript_24455:701-1054(-)